MKGVDAATRILNHFGALTPGGDVMQSFELVDLERDLSVTHDKNVPFSLANWTKLHGGMDANTPRIWPFVSYSQNALITTPNAEYGLYDIGNRVTQDFMEFFWNFDETEAIRLANLGVLTQANLTTTRLFKYGRSTNPWFNTRPTDNELPLGLLPAAGVPVYQGPKSLMRPLLVWQEKAQMEIVDNGAGATIPPWAAATSGAMVAAWGKYYEM